MKVYIEKDPRITWVGTPPWRVSSDGGIMQGGFYSRKGAVEYAKAMGDEIIKKEGEE